MGKIESSSSSWSSDWATGSGFLDRTSITDRVPSPLRRPESHASGTRGAKGEDVPRSDKLLFVIQPQKVGDEIEVVRVLAYRILFSGVPELGVTD